MTSLSIIIVSWNVRELLKECLNSIREESEKQDWEIIVVDNHSCDGSADMVTKHFPQVKLILNNENVGFGRAINQAAQLAHGELLFVLNPDTIVKEGTLSKIKGFMEKNPQVGVGGCFVYYPDGRLQDCFFRFPSLTTSFSKSFSLFRILPRTKVTDSLFNTISVSNGQIPDSVSGSAMVIRKSAFEQVGCFDESYFMYYEETDLCYRIKQNNWKIAVIPETKIVHLHQQSARKNFSVSVFHSFKSEFRFFRKFHPKYQLPILRLLQFLGIFFRSGYWSINYLLRNKDFVTPAKLKGYASLLLADYGYNKSLLKL